MVPNTKPKVCPMCFCDELKDLVYAGKFSPGMIDAYRKDHALGPLCTNHAVPKKEKSNGKNSRR